ncbi:aryl-alcohol dehydrogenase-like predicted oxidoreductase [Sinobacterium caligoides]|uniref:Aryl-alcohol dehydrogenase-like predicted oxidoreductase n=1 Tax=Sinobacterium caligoides TaxID=933926 RepID=A0A3N2DG89_9GAMM|nr:aldo/keto reductase [Sinobacterium caligoides]ROR98815.1 aryl-alcohol dehydrogenase-like predicted oxidoreductase [Sinobacterium caligoides]
MSDIMQRRPIADTGITVSPLGLGTVKLGRDQGVKYPHGFKIPNDREALSLINLAHDLGINLIDTAPAYGNSEQRLGTLLKGQRQDWVICSKVGENFIDGESSFHFDRASVIDSIDRSLQRLNTDYIDMVLVHSDGNDVDIINRYGILDVLNEIKKSGKIRATGMSTKTVEGGILAAQLSDCVMATYNLAYTDEKPVLDYCASHNKAVLIKKALASGHLCLNKNEDPVQKSFEFIFQNKGVCSAIVGTINEKHLRSNMEALNQYLQRSV